MTSQEIATTRIFPASILPPQGGGRKVGALRHEKEADPRTAGEFDVL